MFCFSFSWITEKCVHRYSVIHSVRLWACLQLLCRMLALTPKQFDTQASKELLVLSHSHELFSWKLHYWHISDHIFLWQSSKEVKMWAQYSSYMVFDSIPHPLIPSLQDPVFDLSYMGRWAHIFYSQFKGSPYHLLVLRQICLSGHKG